MGRLAKALVAGSNAVMIGSLLAGTDEAPEFYLKKEINCGRYIVVQPLLNINWTE